MKIEAGKFYRTRNGQKVGPLSCSIGNPIWPWNVYDQKYESGCIYWYPDGQTACYGNRSEPADGYELVAEWVDELGLVRSVTHKEIVAGRHGQLYVGQRDNDFLPIRIELNGAFTAAELRNEIVKLTEIVNAMDEIAK